MSSPREPLLRAVGVRKSFPIRRGLLRRVGGWVHAVDEVDLEIGRGEVVGLVGESGSGKTTLGRTLIRLIEPTAGAIEFRSRDLCALSGAALRAARRDFQMVFQDPYGSLNPRMRVGQLLEEPLAVHAVVPKAGRSSRVAELLERVGMPVSAAAKYPHEFSGGQRQRIGIARAIATEPSFLVADEPVSALDVSVQAQIVELLADLQRELGLSVLFISHDLSVVREIADRVAVLYLGRIVEQGPTEQVYRSPQHPYTASLLSAIPVVDPEQRRRRILLEGEIPSPSDRPSGCHFHPRCPIAAERCQTESPVLCRLPVTGRDTSERWASCHFPGEMDSDPEDP